MQLLPWQIFAWGCVCGVIITLFSLLVIILRYAYKTGVEVKQDKNKKTTEE